MRNREFILALGLVGAVAWSARAGDGRSAEDRLAALEAQAGPRDWSARPFGDRFRMIEARLDRLEGATKSGSQPAVPARPGRNVTDLEDPRKAEAPPKSGAAGRAVLLYGEWVGAYMTALLKQLEMEMLERSQGDPGSAAGEIRARDLRLAREDLAVLIDECERARGAYRAATK